MISAVHGTCQARPGLADRLLAGERAALGRAISLVENAAPGAAELLRAIQPVLGRARFIGVTGSPGVGKSSLVNAFIRVLRERDQSVGVIAVDPSSPYSGGAILGDRIRMADCAADPEVFIRSLAARGNVGGLSPTAARIADLMDAAGKQVVILETVGAGQSEIEVADVADVKVVVSAPGLGDGIQAIKAGILEIADILVVNKADLPNADRTVDQLRRMLELRGDNATPVAVIATCAHSGEGLTRLVDEVEICALRRAKSGRMDPMQRARRVLAHSAAALAGRWVRQADDASITALCRRLQRGDLDADAAAAELLGLRDD